MHNYAVQRPNVSVDGSSDIDLHVTTGPVRYGLGPTAASVAFRCRLLRLTAV